MCLHYGAKLDEAHDAASDAIAACRLAWVVGAKGRAVRNRPGEAASIQVAWDEARADLASLHEAQTRWALEERERFAEYKRSIGEPEAADRIEAERGWPVLAVMAHEPPVFAAAKRA
jgi:DNA polymerase-3 subunit epsilon